MTYCHKPVLYRPQTDCGEMAEQAEGAPLLREYGVKNSIEGSNPSLTAICLICLAPVAQLDRVLGYEPSGQRFESFRVRHFSLISIFFSIPFNPIFVSKVNALTVSSVIAFLRIKRKEVKFLWSFLSTVKPPSYRATYWLLVFRCTTAVAMFVFFAGTTWTRFITPDFMVFFHRILSALFIL